MNRRTLLTLVAALLIIVVAPVAWWLISPLFIDQTVDEAFPFNVPTAGEMAAMADAEKEAVVQEVVVALENQELMESLSKDQMETLEGQIMEVAAEMPDKELSEEMPSASADEWVVVAEGEFKDADSFHQGSGRATIYQQGDTRVMRFEDFESTNGPDLHVLLVENVDGTSSADLGEYVDLGSLKGNKGNQNYEIPDDVELTKFSGVMIYCMPFHVVFSTAQF